MKYANITQEVLDLVIGETYISTYTLKDELDKVEEDIITSEYELSTLDYDPDYKKISSFTAWTNSYVLFLVDTVFGDQVITKVKRNP